LTVARLKHITGFLYVLYASENTFGDLETSD
jgi:hypothetical protein